MLVEAPSTRVSEKPLLTLNLITRSPRTLIEFACRESSGRDINSLHTSSKHDQYNSTRCEIMGNSDVEPDLNRVEVKKQASNKQLGQKQLQESENLPPHRNGAKLSCPFQMRCCMKTLSYCHFLSLTERSRKMISKNRRKEKSIMRNLIIYKSMTAVREQDHELRCGSESLAAVREQDHELRCSSESMAAVCEQDHELRCGSENMATVREQDLELRCESGLLPLNVNNNRYLDDDDDEADGIGDESGVEQSSDGSSDEQDDQEKHEDINSGYEDISDAMEDQYANSDSDCNEHDDGDGISSEDGDVPDKAESDAAKRNAEVDAKYRAYGQSSTDECDGDYYTRAVVSEIQLENEKSQPSSRQGSPSTERAKQQGPNSICPDLNDPFQEFFYDERITPVLISNEAPLTSSSNFQKCKQAFETLKQRAFGDDFEDYFEGDESEDEITRKSVSSTDVSMSKKQSATFTSGSDTDLHRVKENVSSQKGGLLHSIISIMNRSKMPENTTAGKHIPKVESTKYVPKKRAQDIKHFNFGRYKKAIDERALDQAGFVLVKKPSARAKASAYEYHNFRFGRQNKASMQKNLSTSQIIPNAATGYSSSTADMKRKKQNLTFGYQDKQLEGLNSAKAMHTCVDCKRDRSQSMVLRRESPNISKTLHEWKPISKQLPGKSNLGITRENKAPVRKTRELERAKTTLAIARSSSSSDSSSEREQWRRSAHPRDMKELVSNQNKDNAMQYETRDSKEQKLRNKTRDRSQNSDFGLKETSAKRKGMQPAVASPSKQSNLWKIIAYPRRESPSGISKTIARGMNNRPKQRQRSPVNASNTLSSSRISNQKNAVRVSKAQYLERNLMPTNRAFKQEKGPADVQSPNKSRLEDDRRSIRSSSSISSISSTRGSYYNNVAGRYKSSDRAKRGRPREYGSTYSSGGSYFMNPRKTLEHELTAHNSGSSICSHTSYYSNKQHGIWNVNEERSPTWYDGMSRSDMLELSWQNESCNAQSSSKSPDSVQIFETAKESNAILRLFYQSTNMDIQGKDRVEAKPTQSECENPTCATKIEMKKESNLRLFDQILENSGPSPNTVASNRRVMQLVSNVLEEAQPDPVLSDEEDATRCKIVNVNNVLLHCHKPELGVPARRGREPVMKVVLCNAEDTSSPGCKHHTGGLTDEQDKGIPELTNDNSRSREELTAPCENNTPKSSTEKQICQRKIKHLVPHTSAQVIEDVNNQTRNQNIGADNSGDDDEEENDPYLEQKTALLRLHKRGEDRVRIATTQEFYKNRSGTGSLLTDVASMIDDHHTRNQHKKDTKKYLARKNVPDAKYATMSLKATHEKDIHQPEFSDHDTLISTHETYSEVYGDRPEHSTHDSDVNDQNSENSHAFERENRNRQQRRSEAKTSCYTRTSEKEESHGKDVAETVTQKNKRTLTGNKPTAKQNSSCGKMQSLKTCAVHGTERKIECQTCKEILLSCDNSDELASPNSHRVQCSQNENKTWNNLNRTRFSMDDDFKEEWDYKDNKDKSEQDNEHSECNTCITDMSKYSKITAVNKDQSDIPVYADKTKKSRDHKRNERGGMNKKSNDVSGSETVLDKKRAVTGDSLKKMEGVEYQSKPGLDSPTPGVNQANRASNHERECEVRLYQGLSENSCLQVAKCSFANVMDEPGYWMNKNDRDFNSQASEIDERTVNFIKSRQPHQPSPVTVGQMNSQKVSKSQGIQYDQYSAYNNYEMLHKVVANSYQLNDDGEIYYSLSTDFDENEIPVPEAYFNQIENKECALSGAMHVAHSEHRFKQSVTKTANEENYKPKKVVTFQTDDLTTDSEKYENGRREYIPVSLKSSARQCHDTANSHYWNNRTRVNAERSVGETDSITSETDDFQHSYDFPQNTLPTPRKPAAMNKTKVCLNSYVSENTKSKLSVQGKHIDDDGITFSSAPAYRQSAEIRQQAGNEKYTTCQPFDQSYKVGIFTKTETQMKLSRSEAPHVPDIYNILEPQTVGGMTQDKRFPRTQSAIFHENRVKPTDLNNNEKFPSYSRVHYGFVKQQDLSPTMISKRRVNSEKTEEPSNNKTFASPVVAHKARSFLSDNKHGPSIVKKQLMFVASTDPDTSPTRKMTSKPLVNTKTRANVVKHQASHQVNAGASISRSVSCSDMPQILAHENKEFMYCPCKDNFGDAYFSLYPRPTRLGPEKHWDNGSEELKPRADGGRLSKERANNTSKTFKDKGDVFQNDERNSEGYFIPENETEYTISEQIRAFKNVNPVLEVFAPEIKNKSRINFSLNDKNRSNDVKHDGFSQRFSGKIDSKRTRSGGRSTERSNQPAKTLERQTSLANKQVRNKSVKQDSWNFKLWVNEKKRRTLERYYPENQSSMHFSEHDVTTSSADNQLNKTQLYSYRISSKGNRPEIVQTGPRISHSDRKKSFDDKLDEVGQKENIMTCFSEKLPLFPKENSPKEKCVNEQWNEAREPAQVGILAKLLSTLARQTSQQTANLQVKDFQWSNTEKMHDAQEKTHNGSQTGTPEDAGGFFDTENKNSKGRNRPLRMYSPRMYKVDARKLRPDYKQNMNSNNDGSSCHEEQRGQECRKKQEREIISDVDLENISHKVENIIRECVRLPKNAKVIVTATAKSEESTDNNVPFRILLGKSNRKLSQRCHTAGKLFLMKRLAFALLLILAMLFMGRVCSRIQNTFWFTLLLEGTRALVASMPLLSGLPVFRYFCKPFGTRNPSAVAVCRSTNPTDLGQDATRMTPKICASFAAYADAGREKAVTVLR